METTSLEKDKERFAEWRSSQKHGREAIPDELWQIASAHIRALGLNRVAQEFRLNFSSLREKAQQSGASLPKTRRHRVKGATEVGFHELLLNGMFVTPHAGPCLALERPDGMRVRIEGQLPDADYIYRQAGGLLAALKPVNIATNSCTSRPEVDANIASTVEAAATSAKSRPPTTREISMSDAKKFNLTWLIDRTVYRSSEWTTGRSVSLKILDYHRLEWPL